VIGLVIISEVCLHLPNRSNYRIMWFTDFKKFKWKYVLSVLIGKYYKPKKRNCDYLFVVHSGSRNWILGSKARKLQANSKLKGRDHYSDNFKNIPKAEGFFFLHQKYFARSIRYNPHLFSSKLIVMYTHSEWNKWYSPRHIAYVLNFAHYIICLNSDVRKELISFGIPEHKIIIMHLGSDPELFTEKVRSGYGAVGFSMAFGPRKNPEMVATLIKKMPHRKFILIGPNWTKFLEDREVIDLPNFTYYDNVPYELYPEVYHKMDVLVSTSNLEGGPVPILEAMLCNLVPVASRTGFCPDLIQNGVNGFLFDIDAKSEEIAELIENAFKLESNTRQGVVQHSWENYSKSIAELFSNIQV
jgi:glycosyltransferase involved in cell wall biosynthesis